MKITPPKVQVLRQKITQSLRIQRDSSEELPYIDPTNILGDISARQNHAIFARRGCGKTLLLHYTSRSLDSSAKSVYLNCEDFKHHTFPNVLIEILDALFGELETHLTGWFGRKKRSRELIQKIRADLQGLKNSADQQTTKVRDLASREQSTETRDSGGVRVGDPVTGLGLGTSISGNSRNASASEIERHYDIHGDKLRDLNMLLPRLKDNIREFFKSSSTVNAVFIQIDDLYHLKKTDQPYVMDYIHRLCKDVPLYFKVATLRHASSLYIDRDGQPIGVQERHDYQPINIDYTFSNFSRTRDQNLRILQEFGRLSGMSIQEINGLFKGQGFDRLVMAGGGVPRDTLSLFLEALSTAHTSGDGRIGKDDVRILSMSNFESRIAELKQDSEGGEQDTLMRGIYALREFCLEKKTNVFVVSEESLRRNDTFRNLINRLLDYRIIHNSAAAITHKSLAGTFQAFAIDIGCYAHFRKLDGRFNELDLSESNAKEKIRSAPSVEATAFMARIDKAPQDVERKLLEINADL